MSRESTAKSTTFTRARVDVGVGEHYLWLDGNSKITAGNGSFENPKPNALSLLQVTDCPHSTPTCRASCYVHELEKAVPALHDLYRHNSRTIRKILDGDLGTRITVINDLGKWIDDNCRGGFRWHVSGDVISRQHANFIALVCLMSPNVNHWIYTRSFLYVDHLVQADNLTVNLSADRDNFDEVLACSRKYDLRLCFLLNSSLTLKTFEILNNLRSRDVIFPDYSLRNLARVNLFTQRERKMMCPVDTHGKSAKNRCGPCRKCLD